MSAFEADRFNHSRTSPEKWRLVAGPCLRKCAILTPLSKELLQDFRGTSCQYTAANFDPMIQLRMIQHLQSRMNGACLRVIRTKYQTSNAGMNHRSRTHGAWFNCNKQITAA